MSEFCEDAIAQHLLRWVDDIVIGENFCPFAKFARSPDKLRVSVCTESTTQQVISALAEEVALLQAQPSLSTTLLVLANGFEDFFRYLDTLDMANDWLEDQGLEGVFQLASFHPDYLFGGEAADSATHFTNRAPYPVLHILREDDVAQALAHHPDAEAIPERNQAHAQHLGSEFFLRWLANHH